MDWNVLVSSRNEQHGNKIVVSSGLSVLLMLASISISPLFIPFGFSVPTPLILLTISIISMLLSKKSTLITRLIVPAGFMLFLIHLVTLYTLIPIGWHSDQRIWIVNYLRETGDLNALYRQQFDDPRYRYPVPWLTASIYCMTSAIGPEFSLLSVYSVAYLISLMLLWSILKRITSGGANVSSVVFILVLSVAVYFHRPFHDLVTSSYGILSLIITIYLSEEQKRWCPLILALLIPLFTAHSLAIYVTSFTLLMIAVANLMKGSRTMAYRLISYSLIVFAGTWLYQIATLLIDSIIKEIPIRLDQALMSIFNPLEVTFTYSIAEQKLHYIYWFDQFSVPSAYIYLPVLTFVACLCLLCEVLKFRSRDDIRLLFMCLESLFMYGIAIVFAYKGLENYVARYLYVYATPLAIVVNSTFLCKLLLYKGRMTCALMVVTAIFSILVMTESFFSPYASLLSLPDRMKFDHLYQAYYGPSITPKFLRENLCAEVIQETKIAQPSFSMDNIMYSNGYIMLEIRIK